VFAFGPNRSCWPPLNRVAILGVRLLIKELFWLYELIRMAGAGYLAYLGLRMLLANRLGNYSL
jgi:threonine efflux protein